jgi:hypothetical protein
LALYTTPIAPSPMSSMMWYFPMSAIFASAITAVVVGAGEYSVLGAGGQSAFRGGLIGVGLWQSQN